MSNQFVAGYVSATLLNGFIFYLLVSIYFKKRGEVKNDRNE